MSTALFLQCLDHDPPIVAEQQSGKYPTDLAQMRQDIVDRDILTAPHRRELWSEGHHFGATVEFLAAHPKCNIGIRNEYGDSIPTAAGD